MFELSKAGEELIKFWEKLELTAYPDPGTGSDPWTIGWGHTGPDVFPGLVISEEEAQRLFDQDVAEFVAGVNRLISQRQINEQHEFDAMVSFAFNVGLDIDDDLIPEGLGDSTLLKKYRLRDINGAAAEFTKWIRAGGKPMHGLVRRRVAEQAMFLGQDWRKVLAEFDSSARSLA